MIWIYFFLHYCKFNIYLGCTDIDLSTGADTDLSTGANTKIVHFTHTDRTSWHRYQL